MVEKELKVLKVDGLIVTLPMVKVVINLVVDKKEKKEVNIQKNDICEIISGPFKREKARIKRIDKQKEEVIVELLEAAVPIPITVRMDAVKVIRRDTEEEEEA